jgi:hypothetical protein
MDTQEKATKLLEGMTHKHRKCDDRDIAIIKDGDMHDTLLNITFEVSEKTSLGMDSVYQFTYEALQALSEYEDNDEAIDSIEADTYTGELTSWLAETCNHIGYLDEVLTEYKPKEGTELLSIAQILAKREAANVVLSCINEMGDL